jgi:hypothetical protein
LCVLLNIWVLMIVTLAIIAVTALNKAENSWSMGTARGSRSCPPGAASVLTDAAADLR